MGKAQNITTLAGGGPNNLPARSASICVPWAVVQRGTTTYISDNLSNRVFKVDGSGNLTVFAGDIVAIPYNQANHGDGHAATTAALSSPQGIALDSAGNVYIADTANNAVRGRYPDRHHPDRRGRWNGTRATVATAAQRRAQP